MKREGEEEDFTEKQGRGRLTFWKRVEGTKYEKSQEGRPAESQTGHCHRNPQLGQNGSTHLNYVNWAIKLTISANLRVRKCSIRDKKGIYEIWAAKTRGNGHWKCKNSLGHGRELELFDSVTDCPLPSSPSLFPMFRLLFSSMTLMFLSRFGAIWNASKSACFFLFSTTKGNIYNELSKLGAIVISTFKYASCRSVIHD